MELMGIRVSIHAPRVGCDESAEESSVESAVSIHAPRVGCDPWIVLRDVYLICFNSRTPCGVRLVFIALARKLKPFQFTHPVWGAT